MNKVSKAIIKVFINNIMRFKKELLNKLYVMKKFNLRGKLNIILEKENQLSYLTSISKIE